MQAEGAEAQVQGAKAARDRAQQDQQAAVQRSRSEVSTVQRLLDESRASLADAQGSHRSALAAANSGRKELQVVSLHQLFICRLISGGAVVLGGKGCQVTVNISCA